MGLASLKTPDAAAAIPDTERVELVVSALSRQLVETDSGGRRRRLNCLGQGGVVDLLNGVESADGFRDGRAGWHWERRQLLNQLVVFVRRQRGGVPSNMRKS